MLVTENCTVNPTAARARIEAVRIPKPSAVSSATRYSSPGVSAARARRVGLREPPSAFLEQRRYLCCRHRSDQADFSVGVVRGDLEPAGVVVPSVEVDRAARADVLDLL